MTRRITLPLLVAALLALIILPQVIPSYFVGLAIRILIFSIFAMSLDLIQGYTGLPSLGHAAFLGVAAYSVGLFSLRVANSFAIALIVSLGVTVAIGALFGLLCLRTRGLQFLMLTLALGQVLWGIAFKWKTVTRGDDGLPGIPRPDLGIGWDVSSPTSYYYFCLIFFAAAVVLLYLIVKSPFGKSLEGIRESEIRMRALGYNVWLHQYLSYLLSALFAGLAGVLLVYYNGFVSPVELSIVTSAKAVLMVLVGGSATLFGPIIGAVVVVVLENVVSSYTERWNTILGAIFVLVVLLAPTGAYGPLAKSVRRWVAS